MSKIVFVDIDGIVADNLEREMQGRQFADSRFIPEEGIIPSIVYRDAWQKIFYSERGLYNSEWVALDTLIEGVNDALLDLQQQGYQVIFLTSRPESMRQVTEEWLFRHTVYDGDDHLVMKAPAFNQTPPNHTYTRIWKAGMVQTLFSLYDASEIVVIDDSQDILDEIGKWIASPQYRGFTSLKEAVESVSKEK